MGKTGSWTFSLTICSPTNDDLVYTNMPSQESFLGNTTRHITSVDLSGITWARMIVNKQSIAGNVGSKLTLKYSDTYKSNPNEYSHIGNTPIELSIDTENDILITEWIQLIVPQKNVYLAVIGSGGDDNLSPHFGNILIELA